MTSLSKWSCRESNPTISHQSSPSPAETQTGRIGSDPSRPGETRKCGEPFTTARRALIGLVLALLLGGVGVGVALADDATETPAATTPAPVRTVPNLIPWEQQGMVAPTVGHDEPDNNCGTLAAGNGCW